EHLPTSYNDIDLCFKFRQAGYRCLYNPSVQAYHFESKSRGRSKLEWEYLDRFRSRWSAVLERDPFYQPRHGERLLPGERTTHGERLRLRLERAARDRVGRERLGRDGVDRNRAERDRAASSSD
ncbi:MAG: hypothetical protein ACKOUR_19210, partial [Planctomycetota bacterium]